MATGNDILGYQGNAKLALGGGAGIDVYGVPDLSPITQTARDVALSSYSKNQQLWRQRIADRDAAFKMIDDDALVLDNILEEDRPIVDSQMKEIEKVWDKYQGDLLKDPMRYREFQKSIANAKNHINQAHKRYIGVQGDLEAKKKMADNPVDQQNFDKNIVGNVSKGFWSTYNPYVPTTPFDLKVVAAKPIYGAPVKTFQGEFDITTQTLDPEKTFNEYQKNWASREYNHQFNEYVEGFLTGPNADADVQRINDALAKMNAELGTNVAPLGVVKDPASGRYIANKDRVDQVAAKIAMADNAARATSKEFAKERAAVNVDREQLKEQARQANMANRLGWAKLGVDRGELALKREQWMAGTKGADTIKNSAMEFAGRIAGELLNLASDQDANVSVIAPKDVRKMTAEQLKYLGIETSQTDDDGKSQTVWKSMVVNPDKDAVLIDHKTQQVKVLKDARKKGNQWIGTFDNTQNTSLFNVATNRLNEENQKSGSKEVNAYNVIDAGIGGTSTTTTGGGTTQKVTSADQFKNEYKGPDGKGITLKDLRANYTEKQIMEYINGGVLQ